MSESYEALDITPEKVEYAYAMARQAQQDRRQNWADIGYRAALARDTKMLRVMEKCAEIMTKMSEDQMGRTRRTATDYGDKAEHTEVALFREAYRLMDEGRPIRNFEWVYFAGALLSGYIV